jgi:hypothetical protein
MDYNGKECREVELSNGDTCYFMQAYKGKEYMQFQRMQLKGVTTKQLNDNDMDMATMVENMLNLFPLFCVKIEDKDEKEKKVGEKYLENVEVSDFIKLQEEITRCTNELSKEVGKKK